MSCFWFCAPSSSAWLRLRRSVTRRRNGQNPSKRFCGELPPACHFTPALEQEVRAHWALTFSIPVYSWYRLQFTILSHNNTDISSDQIRIFFFFQQFVTVTAVKLSSLTVVITALRATCTFFVVDLAWDKMRCLFFSVYLDSHVTSPSSIFFFLCFVGVCWRWTTIVPGTLPTVFVPDVLRTKQALY